MAEQALPSKSKIKIGQIGICHAHASERMNSLRRLKDDFEVVGVVDDRHYSSEARNTGDNLKAYQGIPWMTEEELFAVPGLQAVLVETTNLQLVPAALRAAQHGLSISMDKPAGDDLSLYHQLLDMVKQKQLTYQIAYMFRNNSAIQWIKQSVRDGLIGEVFEIDASMSHNYGGKKYQKYLSEYPGGIMFLLGCHHIDWIVDLLGPPPTVLPFLTQTKHALKNSRNLALAVLQYPHAIASVHACDLEVGGNPHRFIKINGSNGSIELSPIERFDGQPLTLQLRLLANSGDYKKGSHTINLGIHKDRYADQLLEFAKIMRGEIKSPHSIPHELATQRTLHQACTMPTSI